MTLTTYHNELISGTKYILLNSKYEFIGLCYHELRSLLAALCKCDDIHYAYSPILGFIKTEPIWNKYKCSYVHNKQEFYQNYKKTVFILPRNTKSIWKKKSTLQTIAWKKKFELVNQENPNKSIWFDYERRKYIIINEIEDQLNVTELKHDELSSHVLVNINRSDKVYKMTSGNTAFPTFMFSAPVAYINPIKPDYRSKKSKMYGWVYCPTSCENNTEYFVVKKGQKPTNILSIINKLKELGFSIRKSNLPTSIQRIM